MLCTEVLLAHNTSASRPAASVRAMDGTLSQMAVAGRDPLLAFAQNLGPELRSHRSTGRDDLSVADQLAKIKGRVKQIQEREERDRRRQRRATRRAAAEGIAPEPQPETEVVSALSARLMWTKSVEARLQAESQALSAKIAREEAERKAAVATLTRDVLGPRGTDDMRITGKLAGAESEFDPPQLKDRDAGRCGPPF